MRRTLVLALASLLTHSAALDAEFQLQFGALDAEQAARQAAGLGGLVQALKAGDPTEQAAASSKVGSLFESFAAEFGKSYSSDAERSHRQAVFQSSLERLADLGGKATTYTVGVTQFADLTPEEAAEHYLMKTQPGRRSPNGGLLPGIEPPRSGTPVEVTTDIGQQSDLQPAAEPAAAPASPSPNPEPGSSPSPKPTGELSAALSYGTVGKRGLLQTLKNLPRASSPPPPPPGGVSLATSPVVFNRPNFYFDWRQLGKISPARSQGTCGSCWAFAAVAALESLYLIKEPDANAGVDLSEQHAMDCVSAPRTDPWSYIYMSRGCEGGWAEDALSFAFKYGLSSERFYRYGGVQTACKYVSPGWVPRAGKLAKFPGYDYVAPGNNVAALKKAVQTSPVIVYFRVEGDTFFSYTGGIYDNPGCGSATNHAMLIVGYDFRDPRTAHWIVKNSWGDKWGEQGFIRVRAYPDGAGLCGMYMYNHAPTSP